MNINWFPGHMAKTLNEIKKDMKLIDIVVMVLDARIPYASKSKEVYDIVKSKTVIMVFNKSDMANPIALKEAESKYKKEGCYTVCTNAVTGEGISSLISLIRELGNKIKYENKTSQAYNNVKKIYRTLIIGIPNVGKSSLINRMAGKKSAEVGNKPGVTKKRQWIRISNDIELMDTPGLLSPNLKVEGSAEKLALTGNIKDEVLDLEILAYELVKQLTKNDWYSSMLKDRYKITEDLDTMTENEMINLIGQKRQVMLKGGVVDTEKVSRLIIDDFKNGKIGKISLE